ncbi:MAG: D-alanine--D-alanine ligase family protein [Planctomycetota bacterium]|jgi:D-alanine-D-alanine ligase
MSAGTPKNPESPPPHERLKVAVLTGGIGRERDISTQSGDCVTQALKRAGLSVTKVDICPDNVALLDDIDVDVCFPALHGEFGEDGRLQQILEDKSLLYTGSGPQASSLAFDKMASKKRFVEAGITTPRAVLFDVQMEPAELESQLPLLAEKFVVKPLRQGSTIGVSMAEDAESALEAAADCSRQFGDCMIEEYVPGREITVSILQDSALPIIEIKSKTGFYDYHAKYIDHQTEFLFDTIDDLTLIAEIERAALDCFHTLGCRHFARVDFILSHHGIAHVLEVNTIPGFTSHSLLPRAAEKAGLSMSDLCLKIVDTAMKDNCSERSLIKHANHNRI